MKSRHVFTFFERYIINFFAFVASNFSGALPTANFPSMKVGAETFDLIRKWSPSFPLMVTEFWSGWFDHWTSTHKGLPLDGIFFMNKYLFVGYALFYVCL